MKLPTLSSYGHYSSDNYGVNSLVVDIGNLTLYFSYRTIVAFSDSQTGLVVSENRWRSTTGKHLNWIDGGNKKNRLGRDKFEARLKEVLEKYQLSE